MDEDVTGGQSRRDALKKIAGAGAVAWTAPMVLSSPASAQQASRFTQCRGIDWNCGDAFALCGDQGLGGICICDITVEGTDFCWGNYPCAATTVCAASSECPPGWMCVSSCCGPQTCAPPCDGTFTRTTRSSGATAAG